MSANHGGSGRFQLSVRKPKSIPEPAAQDPALDVQTESGIPVAGSENSTNDCYGLRHIFGTPKDSQRYQGFGFATECEVEKTRKMLERLAMQVGSNQILPGQDDHWANPRIPAGYTYLSQLVGHDLILSSNPISPIQAGGETFNLRRDGLMLNTLYGGGPHHLPHCYDVKLRTSETRSLLKLSRVKLDPSDRGEAPLRDIPRVEFTGGSGHVGRGCGNDSKRWSDVLIADPRNDDNAILSQLTTLFHIFHNLVVDRLSQPDVKLEDPFEQFLCARDFVTLAYRRIIRNDLLSRLLKCCVYTRYNTQSPSFLDITSDERIPLEFAHAVCRFGHFMVRPDYQIHQDSRQELLHVLETSSARSPVSFPLTPEWIADWSLFFDINENERGCGDELSNGENRKFNKSVRLRPHLPVLLTTSEIVKSPDQKGSGLLYRDLIRGAASSLWSVKGLKEWLCANGHNELVSLSKLLADDKHRACTIDEWLNDECRSHHLTLEERKNIAEDPPLIFYMLFEAHREEDGENLGLLGSLILAEVLYRSLLQEPRSRSRFARHGDESLEDYFVNIIGVSAPRTMPELIRLVADEARKMHAEIPPV